MSARSKGSKKSTYYEDETKKVQQLVTKKLQHYFNTQRVENEFDSSGRGRYNTTPLLGRIELAYLTAADKQSCQKHKRPADENKAQNDHPQNSMTVKEKKAKSSKTEEKESTGADGKKDQLRDGDEGDASRMKRGKKARTVEKEKKDDARVKRTVVSPIINGSSSIKGRFKEKEVARLARNASNVMTSVSVEKIETVHRFRRQPVPYEATLKGKVPHISNSVHAVLNTEEAWQYAEENEERKLAKEYEGKKSKATNEKKKDKAKPSTRKQSNSEFLPLSQRAEKKQQEKSKENTNTKEDVKTKDQQAAESRDDSTHAIVPINLRDDEQTDNNTDNDADDKQLARQPCEDEKDYKPKSARRTSIFLTEEDHLESSSEDKLGDETVPGKENENNTEGQQAAFCDNNDLDAEKKSDSISIATRSSEMQLDEGAVDYNYSDASWEDGDGDENLNGRKSRMLDVHDDVDDRKSYTYSADPNFSAEEEDRKSIHSNRSHGNILDVDDHKSYTYSADPNFSTEEGDGKSIHSNRNYGNMLDIDDQKSYTYSADPDFSDPEDGKSSVSGSRGRIQEDDEKSIDSNHNQDGVKKSPDELVDFYDQKSYTYSADPHFSDPEDVNSLASAKISQDDGKSIHSNHRHGSIASSAGGKVGDESSSGANCRRSSTTSSRTQEYIRTESVVSLTELVKKSTIEENNGEVIVYEK